jgi:acyl-CoA-binding protein
VSTSLLSTYKAAELAEISRLESSLPKDANMMDVDRVFVHALNTVKKIPRTGSARPPPADRLRLYGLYKQAMEGDVDGVMDRPSRSNDGHDDEKELVAEQDKWDSWDAQKGISRTEAKRRYIEALIDTMHKYASTTA